MANADLITALDNETEIELETIGRVSQRPNTRPVWFVRHEDTLYLMPITGAASNWYRNVVQTPRIHISVGDTEHDTDAAPITDPDQVRRVFDDFSAKYGADKVEKFHPKPEVAVQAPLG
jgi:deazaflavin-dependent oxidoreductase (nitroreductase family)